MFVSKEVTQNLLQSSKEEKEIINSLSWRNRPVSVKDAIDNAFKSLSSLNKSEWGCYNGKKFYEIAVIDTTMLVENICKELSSKKEEKFYFLEIGAGAFQCGKYVADFINRKRSLFPSLQKTHIISIRGETNQNTANPRKRDLHII